MKKPADQTTPTTVERTPDGVRIVMPVPRIKFVIAFLGLWLVGWAAGEISVLHTLTRLPSLISPMTLFYLVWLVGWTIGGVAAALLLAIVLDGKETVTFTPERIVRRIEAYGRGLDFPYSMEAAGHLRVMYDSNDEGNLIGFDWKDKTVRFGTGLNETNAEKAVDAVWEVFPQLMSRVERERHDEEEADSATDASDA
jgi:hypothetical protein